MLTLALTVVLCARPAVAAPLLPPPALDAGTPQLHAEQGVEPSLYGAAELGALALPSGTPEGQTDGFGVVHPLLGLRFGDGFALELGPTFRFRLLDLAPLQRDRDLGGLLRREDWDSLSDFGQLLQSLEVGTDASVFQLKAGAAWKKTLGLGHLISRYSNQDDPDSHPASADAVLQLGPTRSEVFVSDVLAARLFAAEVTWDLGRTFSPASDTADRYQLALGLAHDAARGEFPGAQPGGSGTQVAFTALQQATLVQLDFSAVVLRSKALRLMLEGGAGARVRGDADLGFVAGVAADVPVRELALGVRVELRTQGGGFRQGFFGPGYELARFSGTGFSGLPLAQEALPSGFSVAAEARAAVGTALALDAAVEQFAFGRTDLDAAAALELLDSKLAATARFTATALGQRARLAFSSGLRLRLRPSLYVIAAAGTVFFPQPDGQLVRGVTASLGAGFDFQR